MREEIERINFYKKEFGITNKMLADVAGMNKYTVDKQMQGVNSVSIEVLKALAIICPTADLNWVLTGRSRESTPTIEGRIEHLEHAILEIKGIIGGTSGEQAK